MGGQELKGHDHVYEPLLRTVMEIAAQPSPLLELRLAQPRSGGLNRLCSPPLGLGAPLLGDVAEDHDGAAVSIHGHRSRRVSDRHERPITGDEPVPLDAHRLAADPRRQEWAFGLRERSTVGIVVVDRLVAAAPE